MFRGIRGFMFWNKFKVKFYVNFGWGKFDMFDENYVRFYKMFYCFYLKYKF